MTTVPVTTIRGTDLLVGALEGLRKKITLGQLVEAQTRLGELLTAIQIDPAPFTVDNFEGPEHATRTDHQVLVGIANLGEEQLAALKSLVARASAGESRSSAAVKTSTRGVDLEVKSYADGLLHDAVDDAVNEYARGQVALAALQAQQWRGTFEAKAAADA